MLGSKSLPLDALRTFLPGLGRWSVCQPDHHTSWVQLQPDWRRGGPVGGKLCESGWHRTTYLRRNHLFLYQWSCIQKMYIPNWKQLVRLGHPVYKFVRIIRYAVSVCPLHLTKSIYLFRPSIKCQHYMSNFWSSPLSPNIGHFSCSTTMSKSCAPASVQKSFNSQKVQGSTIRPDLPWLVMMLPSSQPGPIHSRTTATSTHQIPSSPIWLLLKSRSWWFCWRARHRPEMYRMTSGKTEQKTFLHWKTDLRQETICVCTNGASWSFIKKRQMPNWK